MNNPDSDEDQSADPVTLMGWRTRVKKLILSPALENKTRLTVSRQPCFVSVRPVTHGACSFLIFGGVARGVNPPQFMTTLFGIVTLDVFRKTAIRDFATSLQGLESLELLTQMGVQGP